MQTAEYASRMMKLGCDLFMAIVGLIGFMNLANTMIINITTKKQEYGVLQAVGMTNKQLNQMCIRDRHSGTCGLQRQPSHDCGLPTRLW